MAAVADAGLSGSAEANIRGPESESSSLGDQHQPVRTSSPEEVMFQEQELEQRTELREPATFLGMDRDHTANEYLCEVNGTTTWEVWTTCLEAEGVLIGDMAVEYPDLEGCEPGEVLNPNADSCYKRYRPGFGAPTLCWNTCNVAEVCCMVAPSTTTTPTPTTPPPTTTATPTVSGRDGASSSDGGSSTGLIIGVAVVLLLLLGGVGAAFATGAFGGGGAAAAAEAEGEGSSFF
eukprot:g4552.t1